MSRYTSATDADRREMLDAIGVSSVEDLFADIPAGVRLDRPLAIPPGRAEQDVYARMRELASRNVSAEDEISFLGAGMYDHYVPSLVDNLLSRSEFLTPYTPYQPEISQGSLQVMFEYQTAISELTGLPVSNASVYEGPSAVAAAGYLARLHTKRPRFLVSRGLHPHARETLETNAHGFGATIEELPLADGVTDLDALTAAIGDDVAAVFLAQPNFLGAVEDLEALAPVARSTGALLIVAADPLTLGVLRPPGDFDVDICVGEGQSASSPPRRRCCARCRAGSRGRPPTSTAAAASSSRCRPASSTSAARRRPPTSAPRRRSTRWPAWSTCHGWAARGSASSPSSCSSARPTRGVSSRRSTASSCSTSSPWSASSRSRSKPRSTG
jgi:glycine cleavage system pyridoxal-binding protein P